MTLITRKRRVLQMRLLFGIKDDSPGSIHNTIPILTVFVLVLLVAPDRQPEAGLKQEHILENYA